MRHDGSMTGDIACIAHMNNCWKDMNLGELVLGQIGLLEANIIYVVQVAISAQAMDFEQKFYGSGIFYLEIPVVQV